MAIPSTVKFPTSIDDDNTLFLVHDSLRVTLSADYNPGDRSIFVYGDNEIINRFPDSGFITLTEQCSDADVRAITFYYGSKTPVSFDNLELLSCFVGQAKGHNTYNHECNG